MKHLLKIAAFVLTLFHLSANLSACWCEYNEPDVPFNFDTAEISLLDNTDTYRRIASGQ